MSDEAREAQALREELAELRRTVDVLTAALDRSTGRVVASGLLNSLLMALSVGLVVYLSVRIALRRGAL